MLVKLPNGDWVNPQDVTCVELRSAASGNSSTHTKLWVRKDGSHQAGVIQFAGDARDELAGIINNATHQSQALARACEVFTLPGPPSPPLNSGDGAGY